MIRSRRQFLQAAIAAMATAAIAPAKLLPLIAAPPVPAGGKLIFEHATREVMHDGDTLTINWIVKL